MSAINSRSTPIPVPVVGGIPNPLRPESPRRCHGLVVTGGRRPSLGLETFPLNDRVDEFGVSGRQLDAADVDPIFSVTPAILRCWRVSGVVSAGKSLTNVGAHNDVADIRRNFPVGNPFTTAMYRLEMGSLRQRRRSTGYSNSSTRSFSGNFEDLKLGRRRPGHGLDEGVFLAAMEVRNAADDGNQNGCRPVD